ncbi:MAG TPA: delta-60 repeat domain-containing protein, partial [Rhodanobacteraceae bacterium]
MLNRVMWKGVVTAFAASIGACGLALAADGTLDTSFGVDGLARAGITDGDLQPSGCRPVVQPDNKIVICGTRLANGSSGSDFLVARFNVDGTLDTTFGVGGLVTIDFDHGTGSDQADGVALQSDGSIVVAGTTRGAESNSETFAVARLTTSGALDGTFGAGTGQATIEFAGSAGDDQAYAVTVQPDDKILIAGSTATASGSDVAIVRLLQTGATDTGFGDAGRVTFGFGLPGATAEADNANGVAIDSMGRIVIAGTANASAPNAEIR